MSSTNAGAETALLIAAEALPGHFSESAELTLEPLTALQATTLSLPGGAFAVESVTKGDTGIGSVILIITGLVDHANGEVFSRDEARTLWSAALTEVLGALAENAEGTLTPGQVHMTDAFEALDNADEAQVVGLFSQQTLACLLLTMPAEKSGVGAAAQLAAAVAEATAQLEDESEQGEPDDSSGSGPDGGSEEQAVAGQAGAADQATAGTGADDGAAVVTDGLDADTLAAQAAAQAAAQGAAQVAAEAAAAAAGSPVLAPAPLQPLTGALAYSVDPRRIDLLRDVMMGVSVELGRTRMSVQDILGLTPGAIIELDRAAGAPVDVLVNGKLIAHGEVVVLDEEFAVRISEVVSPDREGRVSA